MSCLLSTGQCGKRWVMVSCWIQKSDIHHDFLHSGSQVRASDKKLSYSNHKESWVLNRCSHWVRMGHSKPDTWVDHWSSILGFQETTPIYDSIVLSGRRWVWCMLILYCIPQLGACRPQVLSMLSTSWAGAFRRHFFVIFLGVLGRFHCLRAMLSVLICVHVSQIVRSWSVQTFQTLVLFVVYMSRFCLDTESAP